MWVLGNTVIAKKTVSIAVLPSITYTQSYGNNPNSLPIVARGLVFSSHYRGQAVIKSRDQYGCLNQRVIPFAMGNSVGNSTSLFRPRHCAITG